MKRAGMSGIAAAIALSIAPAFVHAADADIQRGRYMIVTGHCNNCHTAGYAAKQGDMPEQDWLLGNPVGYRMGTGTSYASNLRLTVQGFTEGDWVKYAKTAKPMPPMPWWTMHYTSEEDLRAMYRYLKHLGPAGKMMPAFVPPDRVPEAPYETRQVVR